MPSSSSQEKNEIVMVGKPELKSVVRPTSQAAIAGALKVLFVTNMYPSAQNPGSGAFVHQQAEHLRKAGHEIDVLHIASRKARLKYLTSGIDVYSRTRSIRYDVVHAHYGLSGFPALFRQRTPLVITLHGSDALVGKVQPLISKTVCSFADAVIVVSKGISDRIAGEIIPCGIDLELFQPHDRGEARRRLGLPPTGKLVLFPFDPARKIKRYELALAAVEAVGDPDVQLIAVSGKRNEDMPWYYSAADAMILCSRSEGSPTSVKEALACNLPVVSTNVGDVGEIMEGIDGCEICGDDASSLAQALKRVLDRAGKRPFEAHRSMLRYDQGRIVDEIVKVYRRAVQRNFARRPQAQRPSAVTPGRQR